MVQCSSWYKNVSQDLFQLEKSADTNKYFQNLMEAKARDPNKTLAKGLEQRPFNRKVCGQPRDDDWA